MSDFSQAALPSSKAGFSADVTMHADPGKVTKITGPNWANRALVRFYAASATPPSTPTNTSGWILPQGTGTAGELIGAGAFHVQSGEGVVVERDERLTAFAFDLACATGSGIANIAFSRV